jgi:GNAT superfamily N-acetyltransferase
MKLTIRPLTADHWRDVEDLFGKGGASNGCWCMYWRIGPAYSKRPRQMNRTAFQGLVDRGPPPGLLAFDGDVPVGWCALTPRQDLAWLARKPALEPPDVLPVWSISCFYVRRGYRRQGIMSALIREALKAAKRAGAPAVEAYPIDTARPESTTNVFTGTALAFRRAGFKTIKRHEPTRPIMRHDLSCIR